MSDDMRVHWEGSAAILQLAGVLRTREALQRHVDVCLAIKPLMQNGPKMSAVITGYAGTFEDWGKAFT